MQTVVRVWLLAGCAAMGWTQASLKGLTGLRVSVELVDGEGTGAAAERVLAKNFRLDRNAIQTEVELRFREAGITIRPPDFELSPLLFVQVSAAGTDAVLVHIKLIEWATLDRASVHAQIVSWERPSLLQAPTGSGVREQVRDGVSAFLNTWLASKEQ